jgi:hypothetical protein
LAAEPEAPEQTGIAVESKQKEFSSQAIATPQELKREGK